jgi:DNA-binding NtrC family response regulator
MHINTILIVDDQQINRKILSSIISEIADDVIEAGDGLEALQKVHEFPNIALILLDLKMPNMDGIEFLKKMKAQSCEIPIMVCSGSSNIEPAITAIKLGARDYFEKPYSRDIMLPRINNLLEFALFKKENFKLRNQVKTQSLGNSFYGQAPSISRLLIQAGKVALSDSTVLIYGETGVGKEMLAQHIHYNSARSNHPLMVIDCSALSGSVLESELFGHKKGAFTGAIFNKKGLFSSAGNGTIFLDEIGELPLDMQSKLLRALQERKIRPLGSEAYEPFYGRIIAATNRNLWDEVEAGKFRKDLYFRLQIIPLEIPPLRERIEDIPILIEKLLSKHSPSGVPFVSQITHQTLSKYSWPGNVRELENAIERALVLGSSEELVAADFLPDSEILDKQHDVNNNQLSENLITLAEYEKKAISSALSFCEGNRRKAAEMVGIGEATLYRKIKDYQIEY